MRRGHPSFDGSEAPIHRGLNEAYQPMGVPYMGFLAWTLLWGLLWFLLPWAMSWQWRTVILAIPWAGGLLLFAVATRFESQWPEIFITRLFESDHLAG